MDGQKEVGVPTPDSPSWPEVLGPEDSGSYVYLVPRNRLQQGKLDPKDMEFAHRLMEAGAIKAAAPTGDGRQEVTEAVAALIHTAGTPDSRGVVSTAVIDSISGLPKQIITRIRDNHIELVLPGLAELGNLQGFPRYVVNRSIKKETPAAIEVSESSFDLPQSLDKLGIKDPLRYLLGSAFQDLARKTLGMDYLTSCREAIDIIAARNPEVVAPKMGSIDPRNREHFDQLIMLFGPSDLEKLRQPVTVDKVIASLAVERRIEGFKVGVDVALARLPVSFDAESREMKGSFDKVASYSVAVKAEPLFALGQTQQDILGIRQRAIAHITQAGF